MSEPREFWIADTDIYGCNSCGGFVCGDVPSESQAYEGNTLHVIEYSALEAERARSKKLMDVLMSIYIDDLVWNLDMLNMETVKRWHKSNNKKIKKALIEYDISINEDLK